MAAMVLDDSTTTSPRHVSRHRSHPPTTCDVDDVRVAKNELRTPVVGPKIVGLGGNRGAIVSAVEAPNFGRRAFKEYLHPRVVPANEERFVSAAWSSRSQSFVWRYLLNELDLDPSVASYRYTLYLHLVLPDAVVTEESLRRGLLMPMLSCNLYDFLTVTQPPLTQSSGSSPVTPALPVFLVHKKFEPIRNPFVIVATLYQVVRAVATLNRSLPHQTRSGALKAGFSHNDLHLANLLLDYDTGNVVLCDFELVQSIPPDAESNSGLAERTPPLHRHPPWGLGQETSDSWGIGLLAVDMLTGIAPFIDESVIQNDFDGGPLLTTPEDSGGMEVLDWESNIAQHVHLMRGVDAGECAVTDLIYDFCMACLTNREGVVPRTVSSLLDHSMFTVLDTVVASTSAHLANDNAGPLGSASATTSPTSTGGALSVGNPSSGSSCAYSVLMEPRMLRSQRILCDFIGDARCTRPVDKSKALLCREGSRDSLRSFGSSPPIT